LFGTNVLGGTQKFPELLKYLLKCLYNFETLVTFEVLPLRLDAAILAPFPMLETFPLNILENVSSIGNGAGTAASSRRWSTSKVTEVSKLYKHFKYFF
jgi:hypothetical protein